MKIGFIESLKNIGEKSSKLDWKNQIRLAGKRTTLIQNNNLFQKQGKISKRTSNQDAFKQFTKQILPKLEEKIEIDLLQRQFKDIKNEQLKQDLIKSYIKRRVKLHAIDGEELEEISQFKQIAAESVGEHLNVMAQIPLNEMGEKDIGTYVQFSLNDLQKYFKDGEFFGTYVDKELALTNKFGLMANEESLKIIEYLKLIKKTQNQEFNLEKLLRTRKDKQQYNLKTVQNLLDTEEEVYFSIVRQFSLDLLKAFEPHRSNSLVERLLATPNVFDFLIRVSIQELAQNEQLIKDLNDAKLRNQYFESIVKQVLEKSDAQETNSQFLIEFMLQMKEFTFKLSDGSEHKIDFTNPQLAKYKRKIPETLSHLEGFVGLNSGAMLYGDRGTGKSGSLALVTMWAHKNDFLVVNVPSAYKLTNTKTDYFRHSQTGLYLQNDLAKEWLEYFYHGNQDLLKNIKVNQDIYGKINYSGVHDNDPVAVPNIYYKERKAYFEDYKQFLFDEEIKLTEELDKKMETRVSDKLQKPQNLAELVEFGIKDEWFACNVVHELMEQLYNLESHSVLVVVDEFNYLYKESIYPSFRYANDKQLDSKIPPYHLSLCRAFVNLDGHKIKNGFKLASTSVTRMQRHKFTPEKINLPRGYSVKMEGLPLDDFRNMCQYYLANGLWRTDDLGEQSIDFLWMQTQGNWQQAQKYMIEHYVDGYLFR